MRFLLLDGSLATGGEQRFINHKLCQYGNLHMCVRPLSTGMSFNDEQSNNLRIYIVTGDQVKEITKLLEL